MLETDRQEDLLGTSVSKFFLFLPCARKDGGEGGPASGEAKQEGERSRGKGARKRSDNQNTISDAPEMKLDYWHTSQLVA